MGHLPPEIMMSHQDQMKCAIDFFTSESTNPSEFLEAKKICEDKARASGKFDNLLKAGYFSTTDYLNYAHNKNLIKGGLGLDVLDWVLKILVEEKILKEMPSIIAGGRGDMRYKGSGEYAKFLYDRDLILNVIGGWNFIIKKYGNSVIKIENVNMEGDFAIGTGFYFAAGNMVSSKSLIITNKHVVENAKALNVYLEDGEPVPYEKIIVDPKRDLAFILLKNELSVPIINIYPVIDILSEVITIGYPSIPMTKDAYQIYHKGEINSFVEDYESNKFFLFSAKTSSGNSGSPIINKHGMVVGIVAQDFFEEKQFFKKGKPSYYAGIPGAEIIRSLNELVFID